MLLVGYRGGRERCQLPPARGGLALGTLLGVPGGLSPGRCPPSCCWLPTGAVATHPLSLLLGIGLGSVPLSFPINSSFPGNPRTDGEGCGGKLPGCVRGRGGELGATQMPPQGTFPGASRTPGWATPQGGQHPKVGDTPRVGDTPGCRYRGQHRSPCGYLPIPSGGSPAVGGGGAGQKPPGPAGAVAAALSPAPGAVSAPSRPVPAPYQRPAGGLRPLPLGAERSRRGGVGAAPWAARAPRRPRRRGEPPRPATPPLPSPPKPTGR